VARPSPYARTRQSNAAARLRDRPGPPVSWRPPRRVGMIETRAFDELVVVSSQLERIRSRTRARSRSTTTSSPRRWRPDGVLPFRSAPRWTPASSRAGSRRTPRGSAPRSVSRGRVEMNVKLLRLTCGHGPRARLARAARRARRAWTRSATSRIPDRARERRALALPARRPREQPGGIARTSSSAQRGGRAPRAYRAGGVARREHRGRADRAVARLLVRSAAGPPACGPRGAQDRLRAPHHRLRGSGAGRRLAVRPFGIPLPDFEGDLMTRLSCTAVEQMLNQRPDATLEAALDLEVFAADRSRTRCTSWTTSGQADRDRAAGAQSRSTGRG